MAASSAAIWFCWRPWAAALPGAQRYSAGSAPRVNPKTAESGISFCLCRSLAALRSGPVMRQDTGRSSNGAAGTPRHWDTIDALRGIAAMGVVLVHAARLFPRLPWRAAQLAGLGLHGVQL